MNWIEGLPPRLMRSAIQVERPTGLRDILLCPACGGLRGPVKRYRLISPEIKAAYHNGVARNYNPYDRPGNKSGERIKSKCCNADMVTMRNGEMLCLYCLEEK